MGYEDQLHYIFLKKVRNTIQRSARTPPTLWQSRVLVQRMQQRAGDRCGWGVGARGR
jgi:hypothetical protein